MVNQISLQNVESLKDKNDVYEGGITPSFIASGEFEISGETSTADTSSISSSSQTVNSAFTASANRSGAVRDDSPNYIPTTGDAANSSGASNDSSELGQAGKVDDGLDDVWNDFVNGDNTGDDGLYTEDPQTGYWSINEDKLEALYRKMLALCNWRLTLSMMEDQKRETLDMISEAFMDTDFSDLHNKTSLTELTAKSNQKLAKEMQRGAALLGQKVQAHNNDVYNKAVKKAEEGYSEVANFFNSGGDKEEKYEEIRNAKEGLREATERNIRSLNNLIGGSFMGLNSDIENRGNEIFEELRNSDGYLQFDSNGYIDMNRSKQWVVDLREKFLGLLNVNRLIVTTARQRESEQKSIFEAFRSNGSLSNRLDGIEEAVEAESAHQTALFDQTASNALQSQKLKNEITYLNEQIEAISETRWMSAVKNICEVIAVAALIVAIFVPWVAIIAMAASMIASGFDLWQAEVQHDAVKPYNPTPDTYNGPSSNRTEGNGGGVLSKSEELQYEEEMLLDQIGIDQIDTLGDGYLKVNNEKIAALSKRLNSIQNMQRLLAKMLKQMAQKRRVIERAFTGLSGGYDSNLTMAAVDDVLRQGSVQFQALVSNLGEYKEAYNTELQRQREYEKARDSAIAGIHGSLGGNALRNLERGFMDYINADKYSTRNITYEPDASALGGSIWGNFDGEIGNIYGELFANGTVDSGDGYIAVNTDKVIQLQRRLERIFITISNITSIIEAKSNTLRAIWQSMGVMVDEADSVKDLNRANFEATLRSFQAAVRALGEKVEIHNRANAAQQEYDKAVIKLVVSVAAFPFSFIGGWIGPLIVSISQVAMDSIDFLYALKSAASDYGMLEKMIASKDADDAKLTEKNRTESTPEWRVLEAAERQGANIRIDSSAIEDIGGGNIGINGGEFEIQSMQLERVDRIKEILTEVLAQMSEIKSKMARVLGGVRHSSSGGLESANYIARTIATQMLQTQMQAVQQYASRHNQINAAQRNAWLSGIKLGISTIQLAISIASIPTRKKIEAYRDKLKAGERNKDAGPRPPEQAKYLEALKSMKHVGEINLALTMIDTYITMLGGTIYDSCHSKNIKSQEGGSKGSVEQKNKEIGARRQALLNYGESLDQAEADATKFSMQAGELELEQQLIEILQNEEKELLEGTKGGLKNMAEGIRNIREKKMQLEHAKLGITEGKARTDYKEKLDQHQQNVAALAAAQAKYNQAVKQYNEAVKAAQEDSPQQSSQVLAGRLAELERQVIKAGDELAAAGSEVLKSQQELEKSTQDVKKAEKDLNPKAAEDPNLPESLKPDMPSATPIDEVVDLKAKYDQAREIPAVKVETIIEGKKTNVEISVKPDGTPVITVLDDSGKPVKTLTLQEYAAAKTDADRKYKMKNDPVIKAYIGQMQAMLQMTTQAAKNFSEGVSTSQVFVDAAEVSNRAEKIASLMAQTQKEMDKKLDGKELKDMKAEDLQNYYEKIYHEIFEPARRELQEARSERAAVTAEMKTCDQKTKEGQDNYSKLQVKYNEAQEKEGAARARIKAYNQYIGKINSAYKKITGQDLPVVKDENATIAPEPAEVANTAIKTAGAAVAVLEAKQADKDEEKDEGIDELLAKAMEIINGASAGMERYAKAIEAHDQRLENLKKFAGKEVLA